MRRLLEVHQTFCKNFSRCLKVVHKNVCKKFVKSLSEVHKIFVGTESNFVFYYHSSLYTLLFKSSLGSLSKHSRRFFNDKF